MFLGLNIHVEWSSSTLNYARIITDSGRREELGALGGSATGKANYQTWEGERVEEGERGRDEERERVEFKKKHVCLLISFPDYERVEKLVLTEHRI